MSATKKTEQSLGASADLFYEPKVNRAMRLTDPAFASELKRLEQRLKNEPEFGKELLRRAGIINSKGKLTKAYGG